MTRWQENTPPWVTVMVVPTGIGAAIGGFGGDATCELNLLAAVSDVLITHPNVANAAGLQKLPVNAWYTEGYALDQFCRGEIGLLPPPRGQRIGVILDAGLPDDMRVLHLNTINALQTVHGLDIVAVVTTADPVACKITLAEHGVSVGQVANIHTVLAAGEHLKAIGATAIAVCCLMPTHESQPELAAAEAAYRQGLGADPIGGIEAILSHAVVAELGLPCAHAPVFPLEVVAPETETVLDPRCAAEFITPTFLPCVLMGLRQAPQLVSAVSPPPAAHTASAIGALVVPIDALGAVPVLAAVEHHRTTGQGPAVIAVAENTTVLNVTAEALWGKTLPNNLYSAQTYFEAAGMITALRQGLPVPFRKTPVPLL